MVDTDVMTVREVAEYLKVKERTIYRFGCRSRHTGIQGGRFLAVQEGRNRPVDRITRNRAG